VPPEAQVLLPERPVDAEHLAQRGAQGLEGLGREDGARRNAGNDRFNGADGGQVGYEEGDRDTAEDDSSKLREALQGKERVVLHGRSIPCHSVERPAVAGRSRCIVVSYPWVSTASGCTSSWPSW